MVIFHQSGSDQNLAFLLYIWGFYIILLPICTGIIISQYKDPCKPISIMACHKGFECAQLFLLFFLL